MTNTQSTGVSLGKKILMIIVTIPFIIGGYFFADFIAKKYNDKKAIDKAVDYITDKEWNTFNSISDNFQVDFPAYPAQQTQVLPKTASTPEIIFTTYLAKNAENDEYAVVVGKYPGSMEISSAEAALQGAVNGSVATTNGTLVSASFVTYQKYPAVDYLVKVEGGHAKARSILVDHNLFTIMVASTDDKLADFDKFANSLVIK